MAFDFKQKLPTPQEIREMYPVPDHVAQIKKERDEEIRKIFTGESDRFIAIIGPCSADNEESVCDYVRRLVRVQEKIKDKVLIIPRIYTNKPRTTGDGYKGIMHQPDPEKKPDQRRLFCYAEFRPCGAEWPFLYLPRLGRPDRRK